MFEPLVFVSFLLFWRDGSLERVEVPLTSRVWNSLGPSGSETREGSKTSGPGSQHVFWVPKGFRLNPRFGQFEDITMDVNLKKLT